jgi:Domain of unknown function (DUF4249)
MKNLTTFYSRLILACGILIFAVALIRCVEPYDLPVGEGDVKFLVVDGFLNTADGKVTVNLFRATKITTAGLPFEENSLVTLEDSDGNTYPLTALDSGRYTGTVPTLDFDNQYRLYIKTAAGKEYRSAFIAIRHTPEIKEVGWKAYPDGTQITVDTEGENNNTRYYRWTFEETWEYHTRYVSYLTFNDTGVVVPRLPDQMIDKCYRTVPSTQIYTMSTVPFAEDIVNDYELPFLPIGTEKLSHRYSILVKQYAISKETYEYLEKLKKTSQGLSGLYAPQPSTVKGNIRNIADASEAVLGYFDAGQSTEKRLLIGKEGVPSYLQLDYRDNSIVCWFDTLQNPPNTDRFVLGDYAFDRDTQEFKGITFTTVECADCRVKKGVTKKPEFWP